MRSPIMTKRWSKPITTFFLSEVMTVSVMRSSWGRAGWPLKRGEEYRSGGFVNLGYDAPMVSTACMLGWKSRRHGVRPRRTPDW